MSSSSRHTWILALLGVCFAGRVAGQAVQRWWPQDFLPAFDSFQGSNLPYFVLLPAQIVILGWMAWVTVRVRRGHLLVDDGARAPFVAASMAYLAGALVRIGVGLTWSGAPSWFTAWIPAFFHVVLATFLVTLAHHHCRHDRSHGAPTT